MNILYVCMHASFPFGFEDGMWDLVVFIPDHCLSNFFTVDKAEIGIYFRVTSDILTTNHTTYAKLLILTGYRGRQKAKPLLHLMKLADNLDRH